MTDSVPCAPYVEDRKGYPDRAVVAVLNWNASKLTHACATSFAKTLRKGDTLVVIDNGSRPDEAAALRKLSSSWPIVRVDRNRGVAGGYNTAIRWARAQGARYVLLLNNDTLAPEQTLLSDLVEAMVPGVAAVGPIVRTESGATFSAGGRLDCRWGRIGHLRAPLASSPYDTSWLDGSCMLIDLDVVCSVGPWDEAFFLYWEEVDWCVRARHAGFSCRVQPSTSVIHLGGLTATPRQVERYMLRNGLLFARKMPRRNDRLRYLAMQVVRTLPAHVIREGLLRGRIAAALRAVANAVAWNVIDARRRGPSPPSEGTVC